MLFRCLLRHAACLVPLLVCPGLLGAAETPAKAPPKAVPPTSAPQSLTVYPARVSLDGPRDEQRLGVLGEYADGRRWDLGRGAQYKSSNPEVARVDADGTIHAAGDGQAV